MTLRSAVPVAVLFFVSLAVGARAQSPEQRQADAQLAAPTLDAGSVTLELTAKPVKDAIAAIADAGGITVRYHSAVTNADALEGVKFANSTVADALNTVLVAKALAFKVTGRKSVFVYPNTAANRAKYTDSVRTFAIAKADVNTLVKMLNQSVPAKLGVDDLRPTIVSMSEARTISVRATPDVMAKIATLIAENDK